MQIQSGAAAAVPLVLLCLTLAACGSAAAGPPSVVQPGAPGEPTRSVTVGEAIEGAAPAPTEADLRFIQGMLPHHAQALVMTAMVPARTTSADIRLLAQRIEVSQDDEIAMMNRWLERNGDALPTDPHAGHRGAAGEHARMPGMLAPEELERLAAASGPEFDRLFLEFMIRHHEGALVMVEELFASPGAGQAGGIYQIASEIASDQRIEIARMRRRLGG